MWYVCQCIDKTWNFPFLGKRRGLCVVQLLLWCSIVSFVCVVEDRYWWFFCLKTTTMLLLYEKLSCEVKQAPSWRKKACAVLVYAVLFYQNETGDSSVSTTKEVSKLQAPQLQHLTPTHENLSNSGWLHHMGGNLPYSWHDSDCESANKR